MFRLDLQRLFLLLTTAAVLLTFANSYYVTYQVQKQLLIDSTLEANRVYAAKLAETTNNFLQNAQKQLAYSAKILSTDFDNESLRESETERLYQQSSFFNSVSIINSKAIITTVFPKTIPIKGLLLPENNRNPFNARKPLVSNPMVAPTGSYLMSISHPIFGMNEKYLGFITGSIYLHQNNVFFKLLSQHSYIDGSYIYVVDQNKELIYHINKKRIGEQIEGNHVIDSVIIGTSGSDKVVNSLGIPMLAGFAYIKRSGWGVVAQRPLENVMAELDVQLTEVVLKSLPLLFLILTIVLIASRYITKPLKALASQANHMYQNDAEQNILNIKSWYFEVHELKRAILSGLGTLKHKINQLNKDTNTDPLTGLYNRRSLDQLLEQWRELKQSFAVIAVDIDHFKVVNDLYGHDVGDEVLKHLSLLMKENCNENYIAFRNGGEEFLILLPSTKQADAHFFAEKLRVKIAQYNMPIAGNITVSLGISYWDSNSNDTIKITLKKADIALYQAKRQGRNCSILHS
ncbi:GGDEF domain-containing protein [Marinomonas rhizomae]|uniref:diguanylate cyclase n=1 Tax=Marinomonas rhizomae TaxID=491948 RepID=A0A366J306_9GAMM|nr:sensor domain-containing diguanylate cyclase [Marinomonas rhizomae]RBP80515.1 diguanylate cyclase (GGDEF)-like protein [Marinomonas rhizomae]RNF71752.1 GGDEF domain-containing protein [Marinomonas rhizomae]